MDLRFQAFIEAAVRHAKTDRSLLWAEEIAQRIVASTPLKVEAPAIAEQLAREAVRAGVAVTVAGRQRDTRCGAAPAA